MHPPLRKAGYHQISRGAYSTAFVHPDAPDVVIKVGKHYSSRVGYYDGFPYFAEQLIDGTIRSKFFPKIYALEWNRARTNFWCIMRRYEKAPKAERTTTSATISATLNMLTGSPNHFGGTPSARYRKAVEQLVDYRLVPDIHAGNIMRDYRSDTPVIIDPILIKRSFRQDFYA